MQDPDRPEAQAPILEEEDGSEGDAQADPVEAPAAVDPMEEWRVEFPLDVLDSLADFYEGFPHDLEDRCEMKRQDIESAVREFLNLPSEPFADEAAARGLPSDSDAPVIFQSLGQFLDLLRSTSTRAEWDHSGLLWDANELRIVRAVFERHLNKHRRLPTAQLFRVIEDAGLDGLNVHDVEHQRWIANITAETLRDRPSTPTSAASVGTLSFEELVRILTLAVRTWERRRRGEEFTRERDARNAAGFSLLEVEDLRELHRTYGTLEIRVRTRNGAEVAALRLCSLLEACSKRTLWDREREQLRATVAATAQEGLNVPSSGLVPLDAFITWMAEVFSRAIGGLARQDSSTKDDDDDEALPAADRHGFVPVLCREAEMQERIARERGRVAVRLSRAGPQTRRGAYFGVEGSGFEFNGSGAFFGSGETTDGGMEALGLGDGRTSRSSRSTPDSATASQKSSLAGTSPLPPEPLAPVLLRSRSFGVGDSHRSSSVASDRSRRSPSGAPGLLEKLAHLPEQAGGRGGGDGASVIMMKGLPPSEAMLAHRTIRACSRDLSDELADAMSLDSPDGRTKGQLNIAVPTLETLRPAEHANGAPHQRLIKPVQDVEVVVRQAILRLQEGAAEDA